MGPDLFMILLISLDFQKMKESTHKMKFFSVFDKFLKEIIL